MLGTRQNKRGIDSNIVRTLGTALTWNDSKEYLEHVKDHGVEQLISIYKQSKDISDYKLLWGDEVEYMVVSLDNKIHKARLCLRQSEILNKLAEHPEPDVVFHPEYGRYMLEATPGQPFTGEFEDLVKVEDNMKKRRKLAKEIMKPSEFPVTVASYPLLGVGEDFTDPPYAADGYASKSLFLPDQIINTHVRFPSLTANIRRRRGSKVAINVPIFKDKNTPQPFVDPTIPWDRQLFPGSDEEAKNGAALVDHIYMDSMGFGMGCCCLQITFQGRDIEEAESLYDNLASLTPIMMCLTAASPAFRGYLSDQDCRWNVISMSVDDRTPEERKAIGKSRYDSIDSYLSDKAQKYNDVNLLVNEKVKNKLLDAGFSLPLANHFAHLYIRDPLVIFEETLDQNDEVDTDHFENIQSTNWQNMRFKPPPPQSSIGWRVEFRSMEVQFTDFENAAFSVFIVLVSRVILSYDLDLLMPISLVDENMKTAHKRNSVREEKFWFRKDIQDGMESLVTPQVSRCASPEPEKTIYDSCQQMNCNEIINGSEHFIGLVPLVQRYLHSMDIDMNTYCKLNQYIAVVSERAAGREPTPASWIRNFVLSHPDYKHDSKITDQINFDLMKAIVGMEEVSPSSSNSK